MEYVKLNNGVDMPLLGFGVYQIAPEICEQCVLVGCYRNGLPLN